MRKCFPIFLIIIGLYWLLRNLGYFPPETEGLFWPLLIIVFGASMLYKKRGKDDWRYWPWDEDKKEKKKE